MSKTVPNPRGDQKKKLLRRPKNPLLIILLNLLLMIFLLVLLSALALQMLNGYTRHDDVVVVPDIKGLTEERAAEELDKYDLKLNITDSVYDARAKRGVVLDFTPQNGSKIKRNRFVYATINNTQLAKKKIPRVHEVSMRQAEALLMTSGFTNVKIKYVSGSFNDLAQRVTDLNGKELLEGAMIPYNAPLILEVSSIDKALMPDSISLGDSSSIKAAQPTEEQKDNDFFN